MLTVVLVQHLQMKLLCSVAHSAFNSSTCATPAVVPDHCPLGSWWTAYSCTVLFPDTNPSLRLHHSLKCCPAVILDECVREHYLARERPNEFQVDVNMEEGDPFNEGEDSAAAVGLSTRPPITERFPTVVQMKDKRAKVRFQRPAGLAQESG